MCTDSKYRCLTSDNFVISLLTPLPDSFWIFPNTACEQACMHNSGNCIKPYYHTEVFFVFVFSTQCFHRWSILHSITETWHLASLKIYFSIINYSIVVLLTSIIFDTHFLGTYLWTFKSWTKSLCLLKYNLFFEIEGKGISFRYQQSRSFAVQV